MGKGRSQLGGWGGMGSRPAGVTRRPGFKGGRNLYAGSGTRGSHIPGAIPAPSASSSLVTVNASDPDFNNWTAVFDPSLPTGVNYVQNCVFEGPGGEVYSIGQVQGAPTGMSDYTTEGLATIAAAWGTPGLAFGDVVTSDASGETPYTIVASNAVDVTFA